MKKKHINQNKSVISAKKVTNSGAIFKEAIRSSLDGDDRPWVPESTSGSLHVSRGKRISSQNDKTAEITRMGTHVFLS